MAEGVKFSELEQKTTLNDGCYFLVVSDGENKRITKKDLYKLTMGDLQNQVDTLSTNIQNKDTSLQNQVDTLISKDNSFQNQIDILVSEDESLQNQFAELKISVKKQVDTIISIGTILPYIGNTVPTNYLICDGSTYDINLYKDLYNILGKNTLPNLKGRFLQGSDYLDLRTEIEAGLPNITGSRQRMYINTFTEETVTGSFKLVKYSTAENHDGATMYKKGGVETPMHHYFEIDASRSNSIYGKSDTVQPPAYAVNYIIKAK